MLTFRSYYAEITYTVVITFLALASFLILLHRYSKIIGTEFTEFLRSNASLHVGVFLATVSIAFVFETGHPIVISIFSAFAMLGGIIILAYFIQRIRMKR